MWRISAAYPTLIKSYSLDIFLKRKNSQEFSKTFCLPGIVYVDTNPFISPAKLNSHFTAISTTPCGKQVRILSTMMVVRAGTEGRIE